MKLLLDADIFAYRAASSAENEESHIALARLHDMFHNTFAAVEHDDYKAFLTGGGNFRKALDPNYKANRTQPKPKWLQLCREEIIFHYKGIVVDGYEADDAIGIYSRPDTVCVSIDKDLRQIPGWHYNFVKGILDEVDPYEAEYNFYRQFLIGDRSDNIVGVKGIGEKKAETILFGLSPEEMFDKVRGLYDSDERFHLNGMLLHIFRKENDVWLPKQLESLWFGLDLCKVVEESRSAYYAQTLGANTQLPVPTGQTNTNAGKSAVGTFTDEFIPMESKAD